MTTNSTPPHSRLTRLFHLLIAVLVILQITSSEFMTAPGKNRQEDLLFEIHEYSGIAAFFLIAVFFAYVFYRRRGTRPGSLFPWFSASARSMFWTDARHYLRELGKFRIPEHGRDGPFASAIHGLGILIIALTAASGAAWFVGIQLGDIAAGWAGLFKDMHEACSGLVWAYLIGHASIALINQFSGKQRLSDMWSLKEDRAYNDV